MLQRQCAMSVCDTSERFCKWDDAEQRMWFICIGMTCLTQSIHTKIIQNQNKNKQITRDTYRFGCFNESSLRLERGGMNMLSSSLTHSAYEFPFPCLPFVLHKFKDLRCIRENGEGTRSILENTAHTHSTPFPFGKFETAEASLSQSLMTF